MTRETRFKLFQGAAWAVVLLSAYRVSIWLFAAVLTLLATSVYGKEALHQVCMFAKYVKVGAEVLLQKFNLSKKKDDEQQ